MVRLGNITASSFAAMVVFKGLNVRDDDYAIGYRDGKASRVPNSRQAFYDDEYILGYANASMERDSLWFSIRAHRLGLDMEEPKWK